MVRLLALLVLAGGSLQAQTITETFGSGTNQFSIDFVTIGNPGNAADEGRYARYGETYFAGSVDYIYRLGKLEISREMIERANNIGSLGITLANLDSYGGISGGNIPTRAATGISWNEAAKFVNWLNISKRYQAAYNFTTSGPNDNATLWSFGQYSSNNQYRHKDAFYFLPSRDEWYKGSYFDPNKAGGSGYWDFPTGSDIAPTPVSNGRDAGTAVYADQPGPADIDNAGGLSPYGTMGQGGNVYEWTESAWDGVNNLSGEDRELRGGAWKSVGVYSDSLDAAYRTFLEPSNEFLFGGFRIATVPEPTSLSLLVLGGVAMAFGRRKRS